VVFPRKTADGAGGGWQWEEVAVCSSHIEGFGLEVRHTPNLDWKRCDATPVYVPLLGRETELSSGVEASLFARVLQGSFVAFPFKNIVAPPPGSKWVSDGLYLEIRRDDEVLSDEVAVRDDEVVLQVLLNDVTNVGDRDSCVYLLKRAAMELLHIPPHIFAVLAAHHHHHHVDRHFSSHVASYTPSPRSHVLVNAHPAFGDAAFAAGCINEPPIGEKPSMEMRCTRLRVRPKHQQLDPSALAAWQEFVAEFPEVTEKQIFFVSLRNRYAAHEELTASYGKVYHRSYSAFGFEEAPLTARVPEDDFAADVLAMASWPERVPGWWNPTMQPLRRRVFARRSECLVRQAAGWEVGGLPVGTLLARSVAVRSRSATSGGSEPTAPSSETGTTDSEGSPVGTRTSDVEAREIGTRGGKGRAATDSTSEEVEQLVLVRDRRAYVLARKLMPRKLTPRHPSLRHPSGSVCGSQKDAGPVYRSINGLGGDAVDSSADEGITQPSPHLERTAHGSSQLCETQAMGTSETQAMDTGETQAVDTSNVRKQWAPRPRGRPPKGKGGLPKRWSHERGAWDEAVTDAVLGKAPQPVYGGKRMRGDGAVSAPTPEKLTGSFITDVDQAELSRAKVLQTWGRTDGWMDGGDGGDEWQVDSLLTFRWSTRGRRRRREFLVRWAGWSDEYTSWVASSEIDPGLIEAFEEGRGAGHVADVSNVVTGEESVGVEVVG